MYSPHPKRKPSRLWRSTRRRLLTSVGVKVPPGFDPVLDEPLWGARQFAPVVNRTVTQVYPMLLSGQLDADHGPEPRTSQEAPPDAEPRPH